MGGNWTAAALDAHINHLVAHSAFRFRRNVSPFPSYVLCMAQPLQQTTKSTDPITVSYLSGHRPCDPSNPVNQTNRSLRHLSSARRNRPHQPSTHLRIAAVRPPRLRIHRHGREVILWSTAFRRHPFSRPRTHQPFFSTTIPIHTKTPTPIFRSSRPTESRPAAVSRRSCSASPNTGHWAQARGVYLHRHDCANALCS